MIAIYNYLVKFIFIMVLLSTVVTYTDCCSSRTIPKSRPHAIIKSTVTEYRSSVKTSVKSLENSDGSDSIISTSSPALTTTISTKLLETTIDKSSSIKFSTTIDNDTKDKNSQSLSTITTYITTRTTSSIITTSSESSPSSTFKPDHGDKPQIAQPKIPKIPCSYEFEENYCLNGGKCYNYTIEQFYIPSCECAEGFMGERCENKYLIGSYSIASKSTKIHLETASICYGAFMALILVIFIIYFLYCYTKVFRKKNQKK